MNWTLKPEGGTRREWARYHVGFSLACCVVPVMAAGDVLSGAATRVHDRILDWAERA